MLDVQSELILNPFIEDLTGNYSIILLGSRIGNEIDVVFIDNKDSLFLSPKRIINFSELMKKHLEYKLFHTDHHRYFVDCEYPYIHLVYYPSIDLLRAWELPSFLTSIYESGNFIRGNNQILHQDYLSYFSEDFGTNSLLPNRRLISVLQYTNIAATYFLYSGGNFIPKKEILNKLCYAGRYMLHEYLRAMNLLPSKKIINYEDLIEVSFEDSGVENLATNIYSIKRKGNLKINTNELFENICNLHNKLIKLLSRHD